MYENLMLTTSIIKYVYIWTKDDGFLKNIFNINIEIWVYKMAVQWLAITNI
jgi:hypothetical protein